MEQRFIARFEGDLADQHRLPAYPASQSLYGISRSLIIPVNYLFERKVRRKNFRTEAYRIEIVAQQPGSFETVFEIITDPLFVSATLSVTAGVAGQFLYDFIKAIFKRATGQGSVDSIDELESDGRLDGGDTAAIVDAIEPAMRYAHNTIGEGASHITIISGDHNTINLNSDTKRYVNQSTIDDEIRIKSMSVASFNANTGYGRAFDFEEKGPCPSSCRLVTIWKRLRQLTIALRDIVAFAPLVKVRSRQWPFSFVPSEALMV